MTVAPQHDEDRAAPKMTIYTLRLRAGFGAIMAFSILGLGLIWHRHDLKENYVQVPATVTSVVTQCAVGHRGFLGQWQTEETDCQIAGQTPQDRDTQVLYRTEVRFKFTSPFDHSPYQGVQILNDALYQLPQKGSLVTVFARRDRPGAFEYGGPFPNTKAPSGL